MKKIIIVIISICITATAFAQPPSIGIGAVVSPSWQKFSIDNFENEPIDIDVTFSVRPIGVQAYLDVGSLIFTATYARSKTLKIEASGSDAGFSAGNVVEGNLEITTISFGGLLKLPISLGNITLFPLLGAEYMLTLDIEGADSSFMDNYNRIWLKGGLGLDIPLNQQIYLRPTALFGFGLPNKYDDFVKAGGFDIEFPDSPFVGRFDFGVALGFWF